MGVVQIDEDRVEMGQDRWVYWIEGFVVRHFLLIAGEYYCLVYWYVLWSSNINLVYGGGVRVQLRNQLQSVG